MTSIIDLRQPALDVAELCEEQAASWATDCTFSPTLRHAEAARLYMLAARFYEEAGQ